MLTYCSFAGTLHCQQQTHHSEVPRGILLLEDSPQYSQVAPGCPFAPGDHAAAGLQMHAYQLPESCSACSVNVDNSCIPTARKVAALLMFMQAKHANKIVASTCVFLKRSLDKHSMMTLDT